MSFALLPPFGQWAFGESRVQNNFVFNRERPVANNIRAIGEIRVQIEYSFNSRYSCSKTRERPAANKIRVIGEIRVRIKTHSKIRVQKYSFNSFNSCSKDRKYSVKAVL